MSRIGKKLIPLPEKVTAHVTGSLVTIKGPKGELHRTIHPDMSVEIKDGVLEIVPVKMTKKTPALWGLTRSLVANMVQGVSAGFDKKLIFEGIGFRAAMEGTILGLTLGFSHPVKFPAPQGITLSVEKNTITIAGSDKELVGQTAAAIRHLKKPEPYKGKGIRYQNEIIRRKAGKKAVASA